MSDCIYVIIEVIKLSSSLFSVVNSFKSSYIIMIKFYVFATFSGDIGHISATYLYCCGQAFQKRKLKL